jgi:PKD repeat protein
VDVAWSPPSLPAVNASAFNVTAYTVFWTTNATVAPYLSAAWPTNASVPSVHRADLPRTLTHDAIGVPDGTTVFAQVVAWNKYGEGLLPAGTGLGSSPVLNASAEPFTAGAIGTNPGAGGPAPFAETFSTPFATGSGTTLVNATYRFSGGASVSAAIGGGHGEFWANASMTFPTPGLINVYLYALDSLTELDIVTTTVLVTPGPAPVIQLTVAPTPVWVNSSVGLSAAATGGSGKYNFTWALGDGTTATGANVTYSYTAAGNYIVTLTATDTIYGGVTETETPLTVFALPTVEIDATANGGPGNYRFAAIVSGGYGNFSYTWVFDDGTQGTGAVVNHTWSAPGTYTVSLDATDGYGHSATATTIVVYGGTTIVSGAAAGSVAGWVAYLLVAVVVVLAVVCLLLLLRGRRPPAGAPAEPVYGDADGPGAEAPVTESDYEEEAPPGT